MKNINVSNTSIGSGGFAGSVRTANLKGEPSTRVVIKSVPKMSTETYVRCCREVAVGNKMAGVGIAPKVYTSVCFTDNKLNCSMQKIKVTATKEKFKNCLLPNTTVVIVQERADFDLRAYIQKMTDNLKHPPPEPHRNTCLQLAHLLLKNVNTLHENNFAHRDIKPHNLFIKVKKRLQRLIRITFWTNSLLGITGMFR